MWECEGEVAAKGRKKRKGIFDHGIYGLLVGCLNELYLTVEILKNLQRRLGKCKGAGNRHLALDPLPRRGGSTVVRSTMADKERGSQGTT